MWQDKPAGRIGHMRPHRIEMADKQRQADSRHGRKDKSRQQTPPGGSRAGLGNRRITHARTLSRPTLKTQCGTNGKDNCRFVAGMTGAIRGRGLTTALTG